LWEEKIFGDKNFDLLGGWQFGVGLRLAVPKKFDFFESYLRGTSVEQLLAWILSCHVSVNDIQIHGTSIAYTRNPSVIIAIVPLSALESMTYNGPKHDISRLLTPLESMA
jgi:hypothetical protein